MLSSASVHCPHVESSTLLLPAYRQVADCPSSGGSSGCAGW